MLLILLQILVLYFFLFNETISNIVLFLQFHEFSINSFVQFSYIILIHIESLFVAHHELVECKLRIFLLHDIIKEVI